MFLGQSLKGFQSRQGLVRLASRSYYRPSAASSRYDPLPANTVIKFVPQQQAWVVERFGKFNRILEPGLAFLLPFIDQIK